MTGLDFCDSDAVDLLRQAQAQRALGALDAAIELFEHILLRLADIFQAKHSDLKARAQMSLSEAMGRKADTEDDADLAFRAFIIAGKAELGLIMMQGDDGLQRATENCDAIEEIMWRLKC